MFLSTNCHSLACWRCWGCFYGDLEALWKPFTFTIFTNTTGKQLNRRFLNFQNPDMDNYEKWADPNWSGLTELNSPLRGWLTRSLSTWEYIYVSEKFSDIGKHNFHGKYFSIIFSLAGRFSVRSQNEIYRRSQQFGYFDRSMNLWLQTNIDGSMRNLLRLGF